MRYIYGGMTLKDYCSKNNIDYYQIINRIRSITDQGYKLSGKEMLDIVLNDDTYNSFIKIGNKYSYNGISLYEYCEKSNINYKLIIGRIFSLKKEGVNEEDVVNIALNDELFYKQSKKYKYLYKGTTLMKYCNDNGYNYLLILRRYKRLKEKYKQLSDDEIYKMVFDDKLYFQTTDMYRYEGVSLNKFCENNGIEYHNVIRRMKRTISNNNIKLEDALKEAVEHYLYLAMKNRNTCRYYYDGKVLKKYCEENNINYNSIRNRIKKLKEKDDNLSNSDLTKIALTKELFDEYMITEHRKSVYNYHGMTLRKYCKLNNLDYDKVLEEIYSIYQNNSEISNEEIIELAIERQVDLVIDCLNEKIIEINNQKERLVSLKEKLLSNNRTQQNKKLIKK